MDNKKRSTLSWSVSLAIHATGAAMILVAGFHLATPKGDVTDKTEFVTVDVNSPNTTTQNAPPAAAPAAPEPQSAEVSKPSEVAPPPAAEEASNDSESEVPKPFTPTEPDENAAAQTAPVESAADTDAAPEPGSSPTNLPVGAAPVMSPTDASVTAAAGSTPSNSLSTGMTPSAPLGDVNSQAQAQSGSQGPLIDETKLMEAFGNHKPEYPWMARLRRQQGTVILRAFVDKDGGVSQVTVEKSSGSQLIDDEAQRSYARWRYQPGLSGQVLKPFKFSLK